MRLVHRAVLAFGFAVLLPAGIYAQDEASRSIPGGGVTVPGWTGQVDASAVRAGQSLKDARFEKQGNGIRIVTGPAATYWNPANTASGDYTVKATFYEPKFMNLNDHPHPYGIMIGGNGLGTADASYLYCAAYGDGRFIVRGFGPRPFQMNGREGAESDAVHKAAGKDQPVTQEIAISVKGGKVNCVINGKVAASYDKSELVTAGKLKSTDGVYGIRTAHNTDVLVTGLTVTKN